MTAFLALFLICAGLTFLAVVYVLAVLVNRAVAHLTRPWTVRDRGHVSRRR